MAALAGQTRPPSEIVIVDNGSTDRSAHEAGAAYPEVRVVFMGHNSGFACAANVGVRSTSAPRVAVLNSDAQPASDWLELIDGAECGDDVWAWGSTLIDAAGAVESAGDAYDRRGFAFKLAKGGRAEDLPHESYDVFAPPGAAPVIRRQHFDELGGYDESFFLYYEDIDLAFRAALRGWRAVQVPDARVRHLQGASGTRPLVAYYAARNSLRCAIRNLPTAAPRPLVGISLQEARWARAKGQLLPFVRGRLAALRYLRRDLATRRTAGVASRAYDEELFARIERRLPE